MSCQTEGFEIVPGGSAITMVRFSQASNGLVVVNDNKYSLRDKNLESTLKKMKQDFVSAYEEIENAGREIDKKLGL